MLPPAHAPLPNGSAFWAKTKALLEGVLSPRGPPGSGETRGLCVSCLGWARHVPGLHVCQARSRGGAWFLPWEGEGPFPSLCLHLTAAGTGDGGRALKVGPARLGHRGDLQRVPSWVRQLDVESGSCLTLTHFLCDPGPFLNFGELRFPHR